MSNARRIEVFSAGCPLCVEAVKKVRELSCPSCDVTVLNMQDPNSLKRAKELGVQSIPAVAIDNKLVCCCGRQGVDENALKGAGLGEPLSSNR